MARSTTAIRTDDEPDFYSWPHHHNRRMACVRLIDTLDQQARALEAEARHIRARIGVEVDALIHDRSQEDLTP